MSFRRFAVTGSNCFTGSHFVDALLEDPAHEVLGLSRSPEKGSLYLPYLQRPHERFRFQQVDIAKHPVDTERILDQFRPDVVIHVAALSEVALSHYRPVDYFEVNTLGSVQLASRLREKPYLKRFLHISSAEIYGSCSTSISEDAPLNPSTPYAVSKAAADMYLLTLRRNFNFPATLIRSTNVYGKHQQLFKIIPRTIIFIKQQKKVLLHGGGKAIKSFIHVRDVVQGALATLQSDSPAGIYHFSTRDNSTIEDIVHMIAKRMGRSFSEVAEPVNERLGQDARYTLETNLARKELRWTPTIDFEKGLQDVVTWVEDNWAAIQKEPLEYVHTV